MKKVALIQSSYIPWKGYFDIINSVDYFVFYDCVQFTKRDWRTRNYIKTSEGIQLIKVPVLHSDKESINKIRIDTSQNWQEEHYKSFIYNYSKSHFFKEFYYLLEIFYKQKKWENLSDLNQSLIKELAKVLKIKTKFIDSKELNLQGNKTDRLIDALTKLKADIYMSGPSAQDYIDDNKFKEKNIKLIYKSYDNYPKYPQLWSNFHHNVTIMDLIFNIGENASNYIWDIKNKISHI